MTRRVIAFMERAKGIEPSWSAWEAAALPLCYARDRNSYSRIFPESQVFFNQPL